MPARLTSFEPEVLELVTGHPNQLAAADRIAELLGQLRECSTAEDYFEFQRELFAEVHDVEELRARVGRVRKRLRHGERVPDDAPELCELSVPAGTTRWDLEDVVLERIGRQLRAVGDALAWRVMGFDRRRIVALSRNEPSGPIVNKAGLPFELGVVDECWRKRGHFALLHDLTSCLRIGDVTEFAADGHRLLEVKASRGRSRPEQSARMSAAVATINTGAPLPNGEELVDVDVALRTHLDTFSDALELSLARGVAACRVPGGRAVVAYSVLDVIRLGEGADDWIARSNRTRSAVLRRAHMDGATHHFSIRTSDRAARSPVSVPYGVYPLDPSLCAGLICDLLVAEIIFDPAALVDAAGRVGVRAEVLLPSRHGQVPPDGDVVRFHWGDRAMISHAQFIDQVLSEFMDLDAVAAGIRALLARPVAPDSAILVFAGQPQIWR